MDNIKWSERILKRYAPSFRHRWEVYDEIVKNSIDNTKIWIDCGCGNNGTVQAYGKYAKRAVGIDLIDIPNKENFIKADIGNLPFNSEYADLITLRFVVEHFQDKNKYLKELGRVLKKGGKIIILTTNLLSPLIFIPRFLLPYSIKSKILTKLFKVSDDDVFPTYHKLNTPDKFYNIGENFIVNDMIFISDLNYRRKLIFILLLIWHKMTAPRTLNKFRTNILVILEKK